MDRSKYVFDPRDFIIFIGSENRMVRKDNVIHVIISMAGP